MRNKSDVSPALRYFVKILRPLLTERSVWLTSLQQLIDVFELDKNANQRPAHGADALLKRPVHLNLKLHLPGAEKQWE
jgi:hypothetical protein